MNLEELRSQESLPVFQVGLPWLTPLVQYTTTPGELPVSCQITITGPPGVGKTRFALQLLDAIAAANPQLGTEFHSFEATGPVLKDMVDRMGITNIGGYHVDMKDPGFKPDTVFAVDSIDFWAAERYDSEYPTAGQARFLKTIKDAGIPVILIHHKTKGGRKQSGSTAFLKITDIVIEMEKDGSGIKVSTPAKNRYPGNNRSVNLVHTPAGLEPASPSPMESLMNGFTSWLGIK